MKNARVIATHIQYDTDGVSVEWLKAEGAYLPEELALGVQVGESEDIESAIADAISDVTGWCVQSFQFQAFAN